MADPLIVVKDFETNRTGYTLPASRLRSYDSLIEQAFVPLLKNPRLFDAHLHLAQKESCSKRIRKGTWERGECVQGAAKLSVYVHFEERELDQGDHWGIGTGQRRSRRDQDIDLSEKRVARMRGMESQGLPDEGSHEDPITISPEPTSRRGSRQTTLDSDRKNHRARDVAMALMPFQYPYGPGYGTQYPMPPAFGKYGMMMPPSMPQLPSYLHGSGPYDMPPGYNQYPACDSIDRRDSRPIMKAFPSPAPEPKQLHSYTRRPKIPKRTAPASDVLPLPSPSQSQMPFSRNSKIVYSVSPQLPRQRGERAYFSKAYEFIPISADPLHEQQQASSPVAAPFPGFSMVTQRRATGPPSDFETDEEDWRRNCRYDGVRRDRAPVPFDRCGPRESPLFEPECSPLLSDQEEEEDDDGMKTPTIRH